MSQTRDSGGKVENKDREGNAPAVDKVQEQALRFHSWRTRKPDELVFTDHYLLDEVTVAQLDKVRAIERRTNFTPKDKGQPFHALEVSMLYRHHSGVGEQLLGVVVDQLPGKK